MHSGPEKLLLSLLLCILAASQMSAQGYVDILPEEIQKPFRDRYEKVNAAAKAGELGEWEGSYSRYVGETYSDVLVWTAATGFAAFRDTCSNGPRAWVNFGSASFQNGLLVFNSEQEYRDEHSLNIAEEFTTVKWGHQRWLIPTERLERFAYAVNSGSWQDYGSYYLKDGGGDKEPKGLPTLPKQFLHILKRKPLVARVTAVVPGDKVFDADLTIDAGRDKGVIVGMSFWLVGVRNTVVKLSVEKVEDKTSTARVIGIGYSHHYNDDGSPKGPDPAEFIAKPGLRFTSRNPNRDEW
jgi:hypothetical protein